jgi:hypothetical protein
MQHRPAGGALVRDANPLEKPLRRRGHPDSARTREIVQELNRRSGECPAISAVGRCKQHQLKVAAEATRRQISRADANEDALAGL